MNRFTLSQIRYLLWLYRLSKDGYGVKNVALSAALGFRKPSVHHMLKTLGEMGMVSQEPFGSAHLTEEGRNLAQKYEACYLLLEKQLSDLYGVGVVSEAAICGILAELPPQ